MSILFIGANNGDIADATQYTANWNLVEASFGDLGPTIVSGLVPSIGAGLAVSVTAGVASIGGDVAPAVSFNIAGLTPSTTNHLYLLQNGTGTANTTGTAPANSVKLGTCVTGVGTVTSVQITWASGRQQQVRTENLVMGNGAGNPRSLNLASWAATGNEGQECVGTLPAGAVNYSGSVILAPATSARNLVQPTADATALRLQRFSSGSAANIQTWETQGGIALGSFGPLGVFALGPPMSGVSGISSDLAAAPGAGVTALGQFFRLTDISSAGGHFDITAQNEIDVNLGAGGVALYAYALNNIAHSIGVGTVSTLSALNCEVGTVGGTSTVTNCVGFDLAMVASGGTTLSFAYGIRIAPFPVAQISDPHRAFSFYDLSGGAFYSGPNNTGFSKAKFHIENDLAATDPVCRLRGASGQSAEMLDIKDFAGGSLFTVPSTGDLILSRLSSTTEGRKVGALLGGFNSNTDASRTGRMTLIATDSGGDRTVLIGEGDGTNPRVGFLGAAAVVRQTGASAAGIAAITDAAAKAAITALQNAVNALGLITAPA